MAATTDTADTRPDPSQGPCRILSLDGGGAKGFYTLGLLAEIEALSDQRLHRCFDLIYGTSTGAIIAGLLALGHSVEEIHHLYKTHVPTVMRERNAQRKSEALRQLAEQVFQDSQFTDTKTGLAVVATKWIAETPMIFKRELAHAHGRNNTFSPGFGVPMADAIRASCSAYPFFEPTTVVTDHDDYVELIDGGYCANNPALYALADASAAMGYQQNAIRLLSLGVGVYPERPPRSLAQRFAKKYLLSVRLLQKTLQINTESMDQLRRVLYKNVWAIRISDKFEQPEMATDFLEHDLKKLNLLRQRGRESFASREDEISRLLE